MSDKLTKLWINAGIHMRSFWENFCKEEKGAAEIVAIILVIVVIVALAVIFRERLTGIINDIFDKTDTFIKDTPVS